MSRGYRSTDIARMPHGEAVALLFRTLIVVAPLYYFSPVIRSMSPLLNLFFGVAGGLALGYGSAWVWNKWFDMPSDATAKVEKAAGLDARRSVFHAILQLLIILLAALYFSHFFPQDGLHIFQASFGVGLFAGECILLRRLRSVLN